MELTSTGEDASALRVPEGMSMNVTFLLLNTNTYP